MEYEVRDRSATTVRGCSLAPGGTRGLRIIPPRGRGSWESYTPTLRSLVGGFFLVCSPPALPARSAQVVQPSEFPDAPGGHHAE